MYRKRSLSQFLAASKRVIAGAIAVPLIAVLAGCPAEDNTGGAKVAVVMSASGASFTGDASAKARVVQASEIAAAFVTVDDILLRPVGGDDTSLVSVFTGPAQLDLLALNTANEVLDTAQVPVGVYDEAQLHLSNALVEFAAAPGVFVDAIGLLDGGVLRVPVSFEAVEGGEAILSLDLSSLSLSELDNGTFQLLPDLSVSLLDGVIDAQAQGRVQNLDLGGQTFTLTGSVGSLAVNFGAAVIFRESDFNTPTGTPSDLSNGDRIFVLGTLGTDGVLSADTIIILSDDRIGGGGEFILPLRPTSAEAGAHGKVEFEDESNHVKFELEVEDLPRSVDQVTVVVDGATVAIVPVVFRDARFVLDSRLGDSVPAVTRSSVIEVLNTATGELLLQNVPGDVIEDDDDSEGRGDDDDSEGRGDDDDDDSEGRGDDDDSEGRGDDDDSEGRGDDDDDDDSGRGNGDDDDDDRGSGDRHGEADDSGNDSPSDTDDDNGGESEGEGEDDGDNSGSGNSDDTDDESEDEDNSGHGGDDDDDEDETNDDDDDDDDDDR